MPEKFKPKVASNFSDSPDGTRKGSQEYLQYKLKRALDHVEYLKTTPLLPSQKGILVETAPIATKKKKVVEKRYGSFNLQGLMAKTAVARRSLREEEVRQQQRKQNVLDTEEARAKDLLSFKLCLRKCICTGWGGIQVRVETSSHLRERRLRRSGIPAIGVLVESM